MATISDLVAEFVRRANAGHKTRVRVSSEHAALFLAELLRAGVTIAHAAIDRIRDKRLREIVETILFAATGGALLGASVGGAVAGPPGAAVGAAVGAGMGFIAGCVAIHVGLAESDDGKLVLTTE